jgi:alkanesulfonate monooxygenase SsuD/methylene tetrahydromethanopterin reductase-like flavin-dependent oxidoreductase (luciferase family)
MTAGVYIKGSKLSFAGLDANGTPTGFTVAGENGLGKMLVSNNRPVATEEGTVLATQAVTTKGGPNVIVDQTITVDGNGTEYEVGYVALGVNGNWEVANASATSVDFERMSNGQYLVTVTISLTSTPTSELANPVGDRGYDVVGTPKTITTRLLLNASKTQILAQAIYIPGSAVKAKG